MLNHDSFVRPSLYLIAPTLNPTAQQGVSP
jgi:hypothetical protein